MASAFEPSSFTIRSTNSAAHFPLGGPAFLHFPAPSICIFNRNRKLPRRRPKPVSVSLQAPSSSSSSSSSSSTPPTSKEEAVIQAKTCLSKALERHLNNPNLIGKFKKIRQPRLRVEIPIIDDNSPASISRLALDVFGDIMPLRRKGPALRILMLWPSSALADAAVKAFETHSPSNRVHHVDIAGATGGLIGAPIPADLAVFPVPEASQLGLLKAVSDALNPKPAVLFNPRWEFEAEGSFEGLRGFVGSFAVVYSFLGLEVRGLLSKKRGVVFSCLEDGASTSERWAVLVEEDGELKVVYRFKARPSIAQVESVLYNKMAVNSPLTRSAKLLRDLVSSVTGKK